MMVAITSKSICVPSADIVAREIEGELIIIPVASGIGDMEDELYTLNDSGKDIWRRLDGQVSLKQIAEELAIEYDAPVEDIEREVVGLVNELVRRKIVLTL